MNSWALLWAVIMLAIFFLPMMIIFVGTGPQRRAAQERAHARRMADHRMNARLLRLNI
jgi:hypothetical protein